MFTEDMPKIVAGYFKVFDAVEAHFSGRIGLKRRSSQGELSLDFETAAGQPLLYFALRWDLWNRTHLPLWIGTRPEWGKAAAESFGSRHPGRSFAHEGYMLSPVDPATAGDAENAQPLIGLLEGELAAASGRENG